MFIKYLDYIRYHGKIMLLKYQKSLIWGQVYDNFVLLFGLKISNIKNPLKRICTTFR